MGFYTREEFNKLKQSGQVNQPVQSVQTTQSVQQPAIAKETKKSFLGDNQNDKSTSLWGGVKSVLGASLNNTWGSAKSTVSTLGNSGLQLLQKAFDPEQKVDWSREKTFKGNGALNVWDAIGLSGQKNIDKGNEILAEAKKGTGNLGDTLLDVGFSGTQMLTDAAIAALTGGGSLAGLASMGFRAFGSSAAEYNDGDQDHLDELLAGAKGAGIEILTEKLGGPFKGLYGDTLSDFIKPAAESAVQKASRNVLTRTGLQLFKNFKEEAREEILSDILNPIADKILKLDNGEGIQELLTPEGISQMLYDGLVGGILGVAGAGPQIFSDEKKYKAKIKELAATGAEAGVESNLKGNSIGAKVDAYDADARAKNAQQQVPVGQQIVNDAINGVPPTASQSVPNSTQQITLDSAPKASTEQSQRLNSQSIDDTLATIMPESFNRLVNTNSGQQDVRLSDNSEVDMREWEKRNAEASERKASEEAKAKTKPERIEAERQELLPESKEDFVARMDTFEDVRDEAKAAYSKAVQDFMEKNPDKELPKYLENKRAWVDSYARNHRKTAITNMSENRRADASEQYFADMEYIQNGTDPVEDRLAFARENYPEDRWEVTRGNQIAKVGRDAPGRTGDDIVAERVFDNFDAEAGTDLYNRTNKKAGDGGIKSSEEQAKAERRKKRWDGYPQKTTEEKKAMVQAENERLESELETLDKKASSIKRFRGMQTALEEDFNSLKERFDAARRDADKYQALYEEASQHYADPAYNRGEILSKLRAARETIKQLGPELDKARARLDNNTQALYSAENGYDARWTEFIEDSEGLERREADLMSLNGGKSSGRTVSSNVGQGTGAKSSGHGSVTGNSGVASAISSEKQAFNAGNSAKGSSGNVDVQSGQLHLKKYKGTRRNADNYIKTVLGKRATKKNGEPGRLLATIQAQKALGGDGKDSSIITDIKKMLPHEKAFISLVTRRLGVPAYISSVTTTDANGNPTNIADANFVPSWDLFGLRRTKNADEFFSFASHDATHAILHADENNADYAYAVKNLRGAIETAYKAVGLKFRGYEVDDAIEAYGRKDAKKILDVFGKKATQQNIDEQYSELSNIPSNQAKWAEEVFAHGAELDSYNNPIFHDLFPEIFADGADPKVAQQFSEKLRDALRLQLVLDDKVDSDFFTELDGIAEAFKGYVHDESATDAISDTLNTIMPKGENDVESFNALRRDNRPVNESDEYIENEEFRQNAEYYEQRYADKQGFDNAQGWAKSNSYEAPETVKTTPEQALEDAKRDFGSSHSEMSDISNRISSVKLPTFSSNADYNKAITNEVDAYRKVVQDVVDGNKSIGDLSDYYASLKDNPLMADYYSERVAKAIEKARRLHDVVGDDKVFNSTKANIRADAATAFKMMEHDFNQATKSIEMKRQLAENAKANGIKINTKSKAFNAVASWFVRMQINPTNVFKAIDGFKKHTGGIGYRLAKMADNATFVRQTSEIEAKAKLAEVSKLDGWNDFAKGTTKATVAGDSWSMLDVLSFVKSVETMGGVDSYRTQNANGFAVDDGDGNITYYCTNEELYNKYLEDGTAESLNLKMLDIESAYKEASRAINNDPVTLAYANAMRDMLVDRRDKLQEVHVKINGTEKAMYKDGLYFPLSYRGLYATNSDINVQSDIDNFFDNERFMQERTKRDGGWISVKPVTEVMDRYISQTSDYLAYAEFGDTLDRLNKNSVLGNGLSEVLSKNFGEQAGKWSERYVNDINHRENSTTLPGMANDLLKSGRENLQQGALAFSVSVPLKQAPSYFDAMGVLRPSSLLQAAPQFFSKSSDTEPALLKYRKLHNGDYTLSEILENKDKLAYKLQEKSKVFNWFAKATTEVDYRTVSALYKATLIDVDADHPGLYKSDPARYAELVDEKFSEVVLNTQPVYTRNARAEYSRTNDEAVRIFSMFRTQQTQNLNRLITTLGEAYAAKGTEMSSEANKVLRQTLSGQAAGALTFALLSSLSDVLLHKRKKYEDKDDNGNLDEIMGRIGLNTIESMAATAWFGDSAAKWLIDTVSGGDTNEFYGVSMGPISTIGDIVDSIGWFASNPSLSNARYVAGYTATALGVPVNNIYAVLNSAIMYTRDNVNPDSRGEYDDILKAIDGEMKAKAKQNKKEAEAYEKFKAEFPETEVEKDPYSLILNDVKAAKAAKPENGNKYDTSGDKGVVDAIISGNLSTKDTDALIKDNTSKTFSGIYDSFRILGLEPQEAINAYTSMDSDSNLNLKQSEMWDWYKQNPDLEFIVAGIWNNKGYSKSWDEYKASKK